MPVGVQVLAPARGEAVMFRVGAALEATAPEAGPGGLDAARSRREVVQ
jgi:Asp-tRNA(Asn)/Glu-tRNA(Gln) amidotransferase A subunit family amidase